jgi:hypothetical protein
MNITVRIKQVYGRDTIYPVCETAQTFARLAGTKTLSEYAISQIKQLGFKVDVEQVTL